MTLRRKSGLKQKKAKEKKQEKKKILWQVTVFQTESGSAANEEGM